MAFDLAGRIDQVIRIAPDAPALNADDFWRPWSYLSSTVDELDGFLGGHGLGPDTRVGIVMRNRPEVVRAVVAVLASRRCVVTLSPMLSQPALVNDVQSLAPPVLVLGERDWGDGELARAAARHGALVVEIQDTPVTAHAPVIGRTLLPQRRLAGMWTAPGVAVQMLTSGTTGPARRADLTYQGLARELLSASRSGATDEFADARLRSGTAVTWAPMVHIGGLRAVVNAVVVGRRLAMLERFEVEAWRRLVTAHRPKVISLVPTALRMVYDAAVAPETFDSVKAVMCGTAPVSPELVEAFEARYGVSVLTMYGATEFGGVAGWTYADRQSFREAKRGSVGRPNPGVSVRVVDPDTGRILPPGVAGTLEVTGGQVGDGTWVRTTDRARVDDDGFLWILGRTDDVIIRGGFKVSLSGLREAVLAHPGVRDAVALGLADERLGQIPVLAVEVPGGGVTCEDLEAHLSGRLQRYQMPVDIRVLDALPRTPSMKPDGARILGIFGSRGDEDR